MSNAGTESSSKTRGRRRFFVDVIAVAVASIVLIGYAVLLIDLEFGEVYRLDEADGALTFEVHDLPGGFYQVWDNSGVSIYSGEKTLDGNIVRYPISGGWGPDSSSLTGAAPTEADFGARDIGGSWFNLTVTDSRGDGMIGDGDRLRIYSMNGTFSDDTVYFMRFGASAFEGIAPYYIVFGFEFAGGDFDSWVEWGPNEIAL